MATVRCFLCPPNTPHDVINSLFALRGHIDVCHSNDIVKFYACPCCPEAMRDEETLYAHLADKHSSAPYKMNSRSLGVVCAECGICLRLQGVFSVEEMQKEWEDVANFMAIHSSSRLVPYHVYYEDGRLPKDPQIDMSLPIGSDGGEEYQCPHCKVKLDGRMEMKKHVLKGGCVPRHVSARTALAFREENEVELTGKLKKILEQEDKAMIEGSIHCINIYGAPGRIKKRQKKISKDLAKVFNGLKYEEEKLQNKRTFDSLVSLPILHSRYPDLPYTPNGLRSSIHCCITCRMIIAGADRAAQHVCSNGDKSQLKPLFYSRPSAPNARLSCPICDSHTSCSVFGLQVHLTLDHDLDYTIDEKMEYADETSFWKAEDSLEALKLANTNGEASSAPTEKSLRECYHKAPRSLYLPKEAFFRLCRICMTVMPPENNHYEKHVKKHPVEKKLKSCDGCSMLVSKDIWDKHHYRHFAMEYRCIPCKRSFADDMRYYLHLADIHGLDLIHFCKRCNLATKSFERLQEHVKSSVCTVNKIANDNWKKPLAGAIAECLLTFDGDMRPGAEFVVQLPENHPRERPHCKSVDCAKRGLVALTIEQEQRLGFQKDDRKVVCWKISCPNDLFPVPYYNYRHHNSDTHNKTFNLSMQRQQEYADQLEEVKIHHLIGIKCIESQAVVPAFVAETTVAEPATTVPEPAAESAAEPSSHIERVAADSTTPLTEEVATTTNGVASGTPEKILAPISSLAEVVAPLPSTSPVAATTESASAVTASSPGAPSSTSAARTPSEASASTPKASAAMPAAAQEERLAAAATEGVETPAAPTTVVPLSASTAVQRTVTPPNRAASLPRKALTPVNSSKSSAAPVTPIPVAAMPDRAAPASAASVAFPGPSTAAAVAPMMKRPATYLVAPAPVKRKKVEGITELDMRSIRKGASSVSAKKRRMCVENFCKRGEGFSYTLEQIRATKLEIGPSDEEHTKCLFCHSQRGVYSIPPHKKDAWLNSFCESQTLVDNTSQVKSEYRNNPHKKICARHFDISQIGDDGYLIVDVSGKLPLPKFMTRQCLICEQAIYPGLEVPLYYKEQVRVLSLIPGCKRTEEQLMEECKNEVQYCCPIDILIASDFYPDSLPRHIHEQVFAQFLAQNASPASSSASASVASSTSTPARPMNASLVSDTDSTSSTPQSVSQLNGVVTPSMPATDRRVAEGPVPITPSNRELLNDVQINTPSTSAAAMAAPTAVVLPMGQPQPLRAAPNMPMPQMNFAPPPNQRQMPQQQQYIFPTQRFAPPPGAQPQPPVGLLQAMPQQQLQQQPQQQPQQQQQPPPYAHTVQVVPPPFAQQLTPQQQQAVAMHQQQMRQQPMLVHIQPNAQFPQGAVLQRPFPFTPQQYQHMLQQRQQMMQHRPQTQQQQQQQQQNLAAFQQEIVLRQQQHVQQQAALQQQQHQHLQQQAALQQQLFGQRPPVAVQQQQQPQAGIPNAHPMNVQPQPLNQPVGLSEMRTFLLSMRKHNNPNLAMGEYENYLNSISEEEVRAQYANTWRQIQTNVRQPGRQPEVVDIEDDDSNEQQQQPAHQPQAQVNQAGPSNALPRQSPLQQQQQVAGPSNVLQSQQPLFHPQAQPGPSNQHLQPPLAVVAPQPVKWVDVPSMDPFYCHICVPNVMKPPGTPHIRFDTDDVEEILDILNVPRESMRRHVLRSHFVIVEDKKTIWICKEHVTRGGTSAMAQGVKCGACDEFFTFDEKLLHHDHKSLRICCMSCYTPHEDEQRALTHLKLKHRIELPKIFRLDCPMKGDKAKPCDHISTTIEQYRQHLHTHSDALPHMCNSDELFGHSCRLRFRTQEAKMLHKAQVAEQKKRLGRQEDDLPCCPLCGTIDLWEGDILGQMASHFTLHAFEWSTRCRFDLCEIRMGTEAQNHFLDKHYTGVHPAGCEACGDRPENSRINTLEHANQHMLIGLADPIEPAGSIKRSDVGRALLGLDRR